MSRAVLLPALAATLLSSTVNAAELAHAGVWQGTLGERAVMVCFEAMSSSFYDQETLTGMRLSEIDPEVYNQEKPEVEVRHWLAGNLQQHDGSWELDSLSPQQITGQWRSSDGKTQLPIRLQPLSPAPADSNCSFSAEEIARPDSSFLRYNGARIDAARQQREPATFNGRSHTRISNIGGTSLHLHGDSAAFVAVNAFVKAWLQTQVANAWECELGAREVNNLQPGQPNWLRTLLPELWTGRWLVLHDELPETFCGGEHANSEEHWYSFDLNSGQRVEPAHWLTGLPSPDDAEGEVPATPLVSKLEAQRQQLSDPASECSDDYDLQVSPVEDGMAFHFRYAYDLRACNVDVTLPWSDLTPFLTPAGKQAMQSLQAH